MEEHRLRDSNELLQAIVQASPLALEILDTEGRIEVWNPAAERIFGWTEEEVRGQPAPTIPKDKADEYRHVLEAVRRGEVVTGLDTYRFRKDGTRVDVDLSAAPLHDADGRVRGLLVLMEDVSERKRAQLALQETTERLQALVRSAPVAITALDLEGRVQLWNPAAERIFGWSEEETLGKVAPAVPPERRRELRAELEAAARGEPIVGLETERMTKEGKPVAVRIWTAPLRDGTSAVRGMMALVEDISEQKAAEIQQRRLNAILEATPDFVATSDAEGNFIYLNGAARRMIGVAPNEDITSLRIPDVYPRHAARYILAEAVPTAIRDGSWSGETELQHRDGHLVPVSQVILAHGDPFGTGEVAFLSTIARDITESRQREQALGYLAEASEVLAASLEYDVALQQLTHIAVPRLADFCMIDVVEDSGVRRVAVAHRDPDREEMMSRLRHYAPAPGQAVGAWSVIETGEPELVDDVTLPWIRAATRDEEHFRLVKELCPRSVLIVPVVAHGEVLGAMTLAATEHGRRYDQSDVALARELARRAALAVENARLYQQSQQATRVRDQVLRIVAHDLRNPLNTIGLAAGMLLDSVPDDRESVRRHLETIQRSVSRANALIQDLLDVAKAEAGGLSLHFAPVETPSLLDEVVQLHRPQAEGKGLRLEANFPRTLPAVRADRDRLIQLFGNLIGNAIKFTDRGGIMITAEREGDAVRFSVRDTGPGIRPEHLPYLFDPFWQARQAERAGAGLGLAISKGIVEAHGGRLEVDSEVGVGTTFSFTIPVERHRARARARARAGGDDENAGQVEDSEAAEPDTDEEERREAAD